MIADRNQGPVDDRDLVDPSFADRRQRQQGPQSVDDSMRRGMRAPEQRPDLSQRQVRPPIGGDQQQSIRQQQTSRHTTSLVRDLRTTPLDHDRDQFAELTRLQPGERGRSTPTETGRSPAYRTCARRSRNR